MSTTTNEIKIFAFNLFIVGTTSVVTKTGAAPIERIKLLLQNQDSSLQVLQNTSKRYKGIIDCFIRIPKEQGFLSLWRGNGTNILRYFPTQALNFAFNDLIMVYLSEHFDTSGPVRQGLLKFVAGGLAGAIAITLLYPLDFCQTKISVDMGISATSKTSKREFNGLRDCLSKVYKNEGIKGSFKGYPVSLVGLSLYRALYFGLFDSFKVFWSKDYRKSAADSKLPILIGILFAQTVTCIAGVLTYPLDTLSRRLMLDAGRPKKHRLFNGILDAAWKIYTRDGFHAYYKGCATNCLRGVSGALVLVFYDEVLYYTQWKKWISPCDTCS